MAGKRAAGKRQVGGYWPAELVDRIDAAAAARGVNRSQFIQAAAQAAVELVEREAACEGCGSVPIGGRVYHLEDCPQDPARARRIDGDAYARGAAAYDRMAASDQV